MLSVLRAYFESLSTWLVLLKYLGLGLAAGSSIWATINVLTVTTADGRKQLTSAGAIAIAFTILGLIISVVSEDLQRRNAAASQSAQLKAEAKRTNDIIIAGQPITSLSVKWEIRGLDSELLQLLKKTGDDALRYIMDQQQGERSGGQNSFIYRRYQLYSFLTALSHRFVKGEKGADGDKRTANSNVLVLIALDDDHNAVLPFGILSGDEVWPATGSGKAPSALAPAAVEAGIDEDASSRILSWPDLQWDQNANVVLEWRLDPSTFANSINLQNTLIRPTAKLPTVLRIAVLFDIAKLPFAAGNLALPDDQNFWNYPDYDDRQNSVFRGRVGLITKEFSSTVRLVPNNSSVVIYDYNLDQVYETLFRDNYGEASNELRCIVFQFNRIDN